MAWPSDWPVQKEDPLLEASNHEIYQDTEEENDDDDGSSHEYPTKTPSKAHVKSNSKSPSLPCLRPGPALQNVSGSDVYILKSATSNTNAHKRRGSAGAGNRARTSSLWILPGLMAFHAPALPPPSSARKEEGSTLNHGAASAAAAPPSDSTNIDTKDGSLAAVEGSDEHESPENDPAEVEPPPSDQAQRDASFAAARSGKYGPGNIVVGRVYPPRPRPMRSTHDDEGEVADDRNGEEDDNCNVTRLVLTSSTPPLVSKDDSTSHHHDSSQNFDHNIPHGNGASGANRPPPAALYLTGRTLTTQSPFLLLTVQPKKKRVVIKHVFDSVTVFGEAQLGIPTGQDSHQIAPGQVHDPASAHVPSSNPRFHHGASMRAGTTPLAGLADDPVSSPYWVQPLTHPKANAKLKTSAQGQVNRTIENRPSEKAARPKKASSKKRATPSRAKDKDESDDDDNTTIKKVVEPKKSIRKRVNRSKGNEDGDEDNTDSGADEEERKTAASPTQVMSDPRPQRSTKKRVSYKDAQLSESEDEDFDDMDEDNDSEDDGNDEYPEPSRSVRQVQRSGASRRRQVSAQTLSGELKAHKGDDGAETVIAGKVEPSTDHSIDQVPSPEQPRIDSRVESDQEVVDLTGSMKRTGGLETSAKCLPDESETKKRPRRKSEQALLPTPLSKNKRSSGPISLDETSDDAVERSKDQSNFRLSAPIEVAEPASRSPLRRRRGTPTKAKSASPKDKYVDLTDDSYNFLG